MTTARVALAVGLVLGALAVPAGALAHASLTRATPTAGEASVEPPQGVRLDFSEPVAPAFSLIVVTDSAGKRVGTGKVHASNADSSRIDQDLEPLTSGWYLVVWRVISADGHPVRGAFTFAVGANPGPPPRFRLPSLTEDAATPARVGFRFLAIAGLLGLTGLSLMRLLLAPPLAGPDGEPAGRANRRLALIVGIAAVAATASYAAVVTAQFALVSAFRPDLYVSSLAASSFGRGLLVLLAVQIVTVATAARARPRSPLAAVSGLAAVACLAAFALTGHAAQRDPTALVVASDVVHLAAASLWLAGLVVLIVSATATPADQRVTLLARLAPPVSRIALVSVIALVATGIIASIVQLPTIATLWSTRYGQLILAKAALLGLVSVIGAINLARTRPRLEKRTNQPRVRRDAATLLRRFATVEVAMIGVIIALTTILTSIAPPSPALANIGEVAARVGPSPVVDQTVRAGDLTLKVTVDPNRAAIGNRFAVKVERSGKPLPDAAVDLTLDMLDMEMGKIAFALDETAPGTYERTDLPALVMVGHWSMRVSVTPPDAARPTEVTLLNSVDG